MAQQLLFFVAARALVPKPNFAISDFPLHGSRERPLGAQVEFVRRCFAHKVEVLELEQVSAAALCAGIRIRK